MKISLYIATLLVLLHVSEEPAVTWLSDIEHDFGDVHYQQPVQHDFTFKNTSGRPLVIDNIRPTCGCTAVDWEELVIEPDSTGIIHATYDAHIKGYFRKMIKVYFSGQSKAEKLWLEGYVIE